MASRAFGIRLSSSDGRARYDYGIDEQDPERGVLVIPATDPDAWFIEGRGDRPRMASAVMATAYREFQRTGEWPANASVFTG
ncbi:MULTISPECIES: hypothetical protein [unclassified Actinotalea]|uniref:hypothetical protein n=1 Tax=unclassified Actinotalea TaxID=2638618 RepID=UPI0015F3AE83|nr:MULTISPECIES: hypothetical protein [unclassified Actinotalea]